ncbi:hypothetical protein [Paraferrimonas haliotis]|uniref:Cytochrome oxidase Cu insertion factor, SCO1/SenC/PrrC family n=1 Tax=Paraferrimonas haliotis TaxID=2013866 RepID=A0AA37TPV9_9GAMM|nr:hypothetical protein [Paraferrimonas haliotis]GLS83498.1 hypothetical protein GCM10007894_14750 [Paraferrimonas haliotis]
MTQQPNRKPMIIVIALFALPVVVAKLFLALNWYEGGVTNRGQLLPVETNYQSLAIENPAPGKWQLVYAMPKDCMAACQKDIELLKNSVTALGRKQDRVEPVILVKPEVSEAVQQQLKASGFLIQTANSQLPITTGASAIADPLGNWVLSYQQRLIAQEQIQTSRDRLLDVKKLLKMSKVG